MLAIINGLIHKVLTVIACQLLSIIFFILEKKAFFPVLVNNNRLQWNYCVYYFEITKNYLIKFICRKVFEFIDSNDWTQKKRRKLGSVEVTPWKTNNFQQKSVKWTIICCPLNDKDYSMVAVAFLFFVSFCSIAKQTEN